MEVQPPPGASDSVSGHCVDPVTVRNKRAANFPCEFLVWFFQIYSENGVGGRCQFQCLSDWHLFFLIILLLNHTRGKGNDKQLKKP